MKTLLILALLLLHLGLHAQTAQISGKAIEAQTGYPLMGATIYLEQHSQTATSSGMEGEYLLSDLEPGTYNLVCEYMGFKKQIIEVVLTQNEQTTQVDFSLQEEGIALAEAIAEVKAFTHTESALLTQQRQSAVVMDGISAKQISKTGDNDAAAAMRRITGVTVEGGKYVYVRGLSDRYSKTTLNGAEIPGLDPNRNTVQMDLFPTGMLDQILVYKTFTPDLYGDFTGGYIDLKTKDFPDQFTLNASLRLGYNSLASFNANFLDYTRGSMDFWALGAKARALPEVVAARNHDIPNYQGQNPDPQQAQTLSDLSKSFSKDWALNRQAPSLDHNASISLGNQNKLFGRPLGWIASLSHQQNFTHYDNGQYGIYELTDQFATARGLSPQLVLRDEKSERNVLWGAMLNASYKLHEKHRLSLLFMHNQAATSTARYLEGRKYRDDPDDIFRTQTFAYQQRSLSTGQVQGKHQLGTWELDWQSAYAYSTQQEPDLHYFTSRYQPDANVYFIKPSSDRIPSRFYRDMQQGNWSNRLDLSHKLAQGSKINGKLKFGGAYLYKNRSFEEQRYSFKGQGTSFNGDIEAYFADSNLLTWNAGEQSYANAGRGLYLVDDLDPANSYDATQRVTAAYGMADLFLTRNLRAVGGLRMEHTDIRLRTYSEAVLQRYAKMDGKAKLLNNLDFLPALNLIYAFSDMNKLRASYSRTLARPSFRELAPFASFDVEGGYILAGNPDLQRSLIDNFDLRWEFYPSAAEIISVSTFYKKFKNPIERTFNPEQPNGEFTFRNVGSAFLWGAEFELRKNLGFMHKRLANFSLASNFSYVYSRTEIDARELAQMRASDPLAEDTRMMFGQAPYSVNLLLSYQNERGTQVNLNFNVVGPRIAYITIGATPEIYEQARPMLGLSASQNFGKRWEVSLRLNNLLTPNYRETLVFKDQTYEALSNATAWTGSLGLRYRIE